ncbi:MAG: peroxiredoxin Q/BCP [Myxococcota bacterium]
MDAEIVGVSKDSIKRHNNFKARYELPFRLVSDSDGAICEAWGTWIQKKLYGREYMGIARATFLIDEAGVVRHVWPKVKVKGHVDEVLAAARAL